MKARSCALIVNGAKELLLIHRIKDQREYWVFPGGSIEDGETAADAVVRELLEETSLVVKCVNLLFEQTNDQRHESYFQVSGYSGEVKLGNGPEQQRQGIHNYYMPAWVAISDLKSINLVPASAKERVLDLFRDGTL